MNLARFWSHPVVRTQRVLLGLILLMALLFGLQTVGGRAFYSPFMVVPAEVVAAWKAVQAGDISTGAFFSLFTLLTYAFLHADLEHLLFNMLYLWVFAALAVQLAGWRWMLVVFLITAVTGGVAHVLLNQESITPMLGASGAVMGFEGLYLAMVVRWRLPDPSVWPLAHPVSPLHLAAFAVVGVAFDYVGIMNHAATQIAYGAHIGGFLGGLLIGSFVLPKPKLARNR